MAAVVAYAGSTSVLGNALLWPLERAFAPLQQEKLPQDVGYIVVLGSSYSPHDGVPVTAALDSDGLSRIVEAVRLMRVYGNARLVVSGGAPTGNEAPAIGYAKLARDLGIEAGSLVILDTALDTASEARAIAAAVGNAPVVLVTSAYHMPRAVVAMRAAGVQPIAAPTGQLVRPFNLRNWRAWLPNSGGLGKTERALHEYAGLALEKVHSG